MKCKNCGEELVSGAKFCINCGSSITEFDEQIKQAGEEHTTNRVENTVPARTPDSHGI